MKAKKAASVRRSMKSCKECKKITPSTKRLTSVKYPELIVWMPNSKRPAYTKLIDSLDENAIALDASLCRRHRDRIMRDSRSLFEIEFTDDGSIEEIHPRINKGRSWFTLFLRDPRLVKKNEMSSWVRQGTKLNRMINGLEKLPVMPKKIKDLKPAAAAAQLRWDLQSVGWRKVYLKTIGEYVVVVRDDDVVLPSGKHRGVPVFTMDEMLRLRHFVGMKPDPEMIQGVWLMKKHLGVSVMK